MRHMSVQITHEIDMSVAQRLLVILFQKVGKMFWNRLGVLNEINFAK